MEAARVADDTTSPTDEQLIAALTAGGPQARHALSVFYRRHAPELRRALTYRVASAADADDLVQDIFCKALRCICAPEDQGGFHGDSKPRTWLWRIARNALIDYYRGPGRLRMVPIEDLLDLLADASHEADELVACVREGFARYARQSPRNAEALRLAAIERWSMKELGAALGRSPNATKEFISQCRKALKGFIEHCKAYIVPDDAGDGRS